MLPDSVMRWTEWPACKAELLSRGWEAENGIVHRTHTSLHCCSKHSLGIIPQVACRICKTLAEPALVHDAQLQAILRQQGLPTQAAKQSQPAQRKARSAALQQVPCKRQGCCASRDSQYLYIAVHTAAAQRSPCNVKLPSWYGWPPAAPLL